MYQFYNPNPKGKAVGDCTIRALTKALEMSWDDAYTLTSMQGFYECDMPSSNAVWGACLRKYGYKKQLANGETFAEFCAKNPKGKYLLCTGSHVAYVEDGTLFDSWDSRNEIVEFFYSGV